MKNRIARLGSALGIIFLIFSAEASLPSQAAETTASAKSPKSVPWDQIRTKAGADYHGDGLVVMPTVQGAQLNCVFQRLDGQITTTGLWLTSMVTNQSTERFQVKAVSLGRTDMPFPLADKGTVTVDHQTVLYHRPGLVEEYSVSMDGVRQDFVVAAKPVGTGKLRLDLAVTGAQVESTTYGTRLVLARSGRRIAYSRLRATDATGKQLPASIEVVSGGSQEAFELVVNDSGAAYPVRIDPTFSDANWSSLGMVGLPGANGGISAMAVNTNGNIYFAGSFTLVGSIPVTNIVQWNGTDWSSLGAGISGDVYAMAIDAHGNLYVGGNIGGGVVKWNGNSWNALGSGIQGFVYALACDGTGNLYAGGYFTSAGGTNANWVAKWNGSVWSSLGTGLNGAAYALTLDGLGNLYVGGYFTQAGGIVASNVAVWNGATWSSLGNGINGSVSALIFTKSGTLCAGGSFTTAGNVNANNIAQWNGNAWSAMGLGVGMVYALAADNSGNIYAGGYFTLNLGGLLVYDLAEWNGNSWSGLNANFNGSVNSIGVDNEGNLYVGGNFTTIGNLSADYVAEYNGNTWSALDNLVQGVYGEINAMACDGSGNVYVDSWSDTNEFNAINEWNGNAWLPIATNGDYYGPYYYALVCDQAGNLYAGGDFSSIDGVSANNIAKWNGTTWSALGTGIGGEVDSLACDKFGNIYAGGSFPIAGGVNATNIAKWNGNAWLALGFGVGISGNYYDQVLSLVFDSSGNLYAAGAFSSAGGVWATNIAKWNGTTWSSLGSGIYDAGLGDEVFALACDKSGDLYAGGDFGTAGNASAVGIAKWNGSTWSGLSSGVNDIVYSLACDSSGNLYAGGLFTSAGGVTVNGIAQWNGSTWSALGFGMGGGDGGFYGDQGFTYGSPSINALALDGFGSLYAGGDFSTAGSIVAFYIARGLLTGTSTRPEGALQVTITPATAVSAGAMWQVDGGPFQNSGAIVTNLSAEDHTVSFSTVSGLTPPTNQIISVIASTKVSTSGAYLEQAPPQIITTGLPNGAKGLPYSQLLSAISGQPPYSWSLVSGALPSGLTLATDGLISGTSSTSGTFNINVEVMDTFPMAVTQALTLVVGIPPSVVIQPTNSSLVIAPGSNITFSATVAGTGPFSYQWQLNGTNLLNNIITTAAGDGYVNTNGSDSIGYGGYFGDGGTATNAELNGPVRIAIDRVGNLFIADSENQRIRKVGTNGIITTVAGNGYINLNGNDAVGFGGYSGDGGRATNAELNAPDGVAVDSLGNLFIADYGNSRIRKVGTNGIITTVAGNGTVFNGNSYYSGIGGAATNATFGYPTSITVDSIGDYFFSDIFDNIVLKVGTNGIITIVAGGGINYPGDGGMATNAELNYAEGLAVDTSGDLFITDQSHNRIRKVDTNGIITTVAGNGIYGFSGDGDKATNAELSLPYDVAVDSSGNIFIADLYNSRVREVETNGIIVTVAGGGNYPGDGGTATNAELNFPEGVAVESSGYPLIADYSANRVRMVAFQGPTFVLNNVGFGNYGAYDVVVSSPYGSITSSIVSLTITPSDTVEYSAGPTSGTVSLTVQFSSPLVDNGGKTLTQWNWNFGDGSSSSTLQNPSHTYNEAGTFVPSFVATNNFGIEVIGFGPTIIVTSPEIPGTNLVQNGGFETGDFSDWTSSGNFSACSVTTNSTYAHSGQYGAELGPSGTPGYLSQTLTTTKGTTYLLSLWLDSPDGETNNQFIVSWNGAALFNQSNLAAIGWTNLQFYVNAIDVSSVLQFGFQDDPSYLGLDDISVIPVTPLSITSVGFSKNSGFQFFVQGQIEQAYILQASTNLVNWLPITNIIITNSPFYFNDPTATNFNHRFYRAVIP